MPATASPQESESLRKTARYLAVFLLLLGLGLRAWTACSSNLWCDEAESSINALTILEQGLPVSEYLGQPIFENTLTLPFPESEEYEFKDSSYSEKGLTVYHGWLPLYSIALAQALCGITPDHVSSGIQPKHSSEDVFVRTLAPRLPALLFSIGYLIIIFKLIKGVAGSTAAIMALLWFSLNRDTIAFGHQARYYSLTLLASAACALAAWNLYKHGRWKDYLWLGLTEAILFHTHQLSAVAFAATCVLLLPRILTHERWLLKCGTAATLAALLTIPWAIWSGFFTTASEVPKAYHLFDNRSDWFNYLAERPIPLMIIIALIVLSIFARCFKHYFPHTSSPELKDSNAVMIFLLAWLSCAFLAFHLLVPAASFFFERLTLIAITPFGCLLGILGANFIPKRKQTIALIPACIAALSLLAINNNLPKFPTYKGGTISPILTHLKNLPERDSNRIYASPNDHLIWTYYTGLPVQSIAPIRKSFLDKYTGRFLLLESQLVTSKPSSEVIRSYARLAGLELNDSEIEVFKELIQSHLFEQNLQIRGLIESSSLDDVSIDFLHDYIEELEAANIENNLRVARQLKELTVFKDLPFENVNELWMGFFYRFSNPEFRVGSQSNVRSTLEKSEITAFPQSHTILFIRESLAINESQ
ncbi:hypothetical protein ACWPKS_17420 [Coraliomargarita sp. W4R72]